MKKLIVIALVALASVLIGQTAFAVPNPGAPIFGAPTTSTVPFTIDANGLPADTLYVIQCYNYSADISHMVDVNGKFTVAGGPELTKAGWDAVGSINGLSPSTKYGCYVNAYNSQGLYTPGAFLGRSAETQFTTLNENNAQGNLPLKGIYISNITTNSYGIGWSAAGGSEKYISIGWVPQGKDAKNYPYVQGERLEDIKKFTYEITSNDVYWIGPDTKQSFKFYTHDGVNPDSSYVYKDVCTLANTPGKPILGNPTDTGIPITIDTNGNPVDTLYGILINDHTHNTQQHLNEQGKPTGGNGDFVLKTKADWQAVGAATNLQPNTSYDFSIQSFNRCNVWSGTSVSSSIATTLAQNQGGNVLPANIYVSAISTDSFSIAWYYGQNQKNGSEKNMVIDWVSGETDWANWAPKDRATVKINTIEYVTNIALGPNSKQKFRFHTNDGVNPDSNYYYVTSYTFADPPKPPILKNPTTKTISFAIDPNDNPSHTTYKFLIHDDTHLKSGAVDIDGAVLWNIGLYDVNSRTQAEWNKAPNLLRLEPNTQYVVGVYSYNGDGILGGMASSSPMFTLFAEEATSTPPTNTPKFLPPPPPPNDDDEPEKEQPSPNLKQPSKKISAPQPEQPSAADDDTFLNPSSDIIIKGVKTTNFKRGKNVMFSYVFTNPFKKTKIFKVIREITNEDDKVISKINAFKLVRSGKSFSVKVNYPLSKKLAVGNYTLTLTVLDKGEEVDSNGFELNVTK